MSAYLCNCEHVGALAAYAVHMRNYLNEWQSDSDKLTALWIARQLAQANLDSVIARYPDIPEGERPGPGSVGNDAEYIATCEGFAEKYYHYPPPLGPLDFYRMAECFDYQACEVENWGQTLAARQIDRIKRLAVASLPGYEDAARDYREPDDESDGGRLQ